MLEPEVDTSVVWWAWAATGALFAVVWHDARHDIRRVVSARNVVLVGLFMWYLLEALQAGPAVLRFGSRAYLQGVLLVVLSAASFLVGYHRMKARWFDPLAGSLDRLEGWHFRCRTLYVGVLLGMIPLVLYGLADPTGTITTLLEARHGWRGALLRPALGDFRGAVLMLENFLLGVAWIALLILTDRRRTPWLTALAALVLLWHFGRAYGSGSRSTIFLSALIPVSWFYWRSSAERRRKMAIAAIPCAVFFYWFAAALVEGRDQGRLAWDKTPAYVGHEMFRELLFAVDVVPREHPHLYGESYLVELINPIPRFLWPGKPVGFGVIYASWQGHDALRGGPTLSPGIVSEMYINFGLIGIVVVSALGGAVCSAWDRIGPRSTNSLPVLIFYSLGLGCLLMMGRSFAFTMLYPLFAALICMAIAARSFHRQPGVRPLRANAGDWRYA